MTDTMTGVFPDRASAERALNTLTSSGFTAHLANAAAETTGYDQGNVLVSVDAQGRDAEAQQFLLNAGASNVEPAGAQERDASGTIGGLAPDAVTDAAPQPEPGASENPIGGIAPSAVTNAPPEAYMASPRDRNDAQIRQTPGAPADRTIVSPGMETPYMERQARVGDTSARRPITDEDIIAEAQHERERDQPADLDVPPDAGEQNASPRTNQ